MIPFSMLLANNNRSKAYLQNCLASGFRPEKIIFIDTGAIQRLPEQTDNDLFFDGRTEQRYVRTCKDAGLSFDEKEHVLITAANAGIRAVTVTAANVNDAAVVDAVRSAPAPFIVYSGMGGIILKTEILSTGKQFIHVHPGWLPDYRGSTTIYYAMLAGEPISCSVIIMNKDIDAGPVLFRCRYKISDGRVDWDYVFDPAIRAATLVAFFRSLGEQRVLSPEIECHKKKELPPFFIMHPVLKHIAIMRSQKATGS